MDESIGLIQSYLLDGRGGAAKLARRGVEDWKPGDPPVWVHMDLTAPAAAGWLEEAAELDEWVIEALTYPGSRPRTVVHEEGVLVVLRGPNLNPGADASSMIPLAIWADRHRLITLRSEALKSITDLRLSLEEGRGPGNVADAVIFLVEALEGRLAGLVARHEEELDRLGELDRFADARSRRALSELRHDVARLRRFLIPQREAVGALAAAKPAGFDADDFVQLREQANLYTRLVEELETVREEAGIVQEEWASRADETMNRRLYVLSIIAAVFLPLTLVSGMLGMNVGGVPASDEPLGFWVVSVVLVLMALLVLLGLRAKRWL